MKRTAARVMAAGLVLGAVSTSPAAPQIGPPPALAPAAATQIRTAPQLATPAAAPAGNAEKGNVLYRKTGCYQCHGGQGQGGAQGPRVGPNPVPFRAFMAALRAPRDEMPPYTVKVMSDQDVADIYAFVRALPPPPPLASLPLLRP